MGQKNIIPGFSKLSREKKIKLLLAEGIITETGSAVPGTYTNTVAGACWNFRTIALEDRSDGIHNPKYVKKILQNSIAALQGAK